MSAGAVFKLIANDGKADRMILATKLINQRIKEVMCARKRAGKADITPTLVDLERTHILFVNAHFKPFAAIGFEYNKVRPQSGNAQFGNGVVFSIPQFGDFFHDMVCRVRLGPVRANPASLATLINNAQTATDNEYPFPALAVAENPLNSVSNIVDAFGNVLLSGADATTGLVNGLGQYTNFTRYCEYPGNALFELVKFEVNGNPLDQYDEIVPTMLEKFTVAPNKRAGHDKLVGQQTPLEGYGPLHAVQVMDYDTGSTPGAVIGRNNAGQSNQSVALFAGTAVQGPDAVNTSVSNFGVYNASAAAGNIVNLNPDGGANAANPIQNQFDVSQEVLSIVNGPQTPKPVQPILEIWNKLRFWFCDDVRLSIASVSIPFGQRFIHIELANTNRLMFEYPSVYVQNLGDPAPPGGFQGIAASIVSSTYTPLFQQNGFPTGTTGFAPTIQLVELYINNIFVNPEIHDIYIKRIGFSLIRVYRQQSQVVNASGNDEKLLSQLKWPIEYMWVGLRPTFNVTQPTSNAVALNYETIGGNGNFDMWRDWHRMTRQVNASYAERSFVTSTLAADGTYNALPISSAPVPNTYWLPVPTVNTLGLTAHGITIYDNFADTFYNSYMPFHYGGAALVTPSDPGALFVNMSLYPRGYQPSGHLNISRARETYLQWNSTYISSTSTAELLVVAVAINFLLITDGSAVLRYST